jgi:hypothetical protein
MCWLVAWSRRRCSWHCPIRILSSFRSAASVTLRAAWPLAVVKRRREGGVTKSCLHLWLKVIWLDHVAACMAVFSSVRAS